MKNMLESELVLNDDGSVYHLHLLPEDIAGTVILVGDQDRVGEVSKFFDRVDVKKQKREFVTHTGWIGKKRLSVVSTGIGTDNIDIVLNELDALVNIDLEKREEKAQKTSLRFVRIGTSGSLQEQVPVDTVLVSSHGLGLDALLNFYVRDISETEQAMHSEILAQLGPGFSHSYFAQAPGDLISLFPNFVQGITATCCGFYAPQGRTLRARPVIDNLVAKLSGIDVDGTRISNFEMETAGIYGLAKVLGHEAVSVNAILANRITGEFSRNGAATVERAIKEVLEILSR
jgi:uridine phosphorylase